MTVFRGQNREREREESSSTERFEWFKTAASEIEGRVLYKHVRPTKQVDVLSFCPSRQARCFSCRPSGGGRSCRDSPDDISWWNVAHRCWTARQLGQKDIRLRPTSLHVGGRDVVTSLGWKPTSIDAVPWNSNRGQKKRRRRRGRKSVALPGESTDIGQQDVELGAPLQRWANIWSHWPMGRGQRAEPSHLVPLPALKIDFMCFLELCFLFPLLPCPALRPR